MRFIFTVDHPGSDSQLTGPGLYCLFCEYRYYGTWHTHSAGRLRNFREGGGVSGRRITRTPPIAYSNETTA